MPLLTAADMDDLQTEHDAELSDTCTIHNQTETNTSKGPTVVISAAVATVACKRGVLAQQQQTAGGGFLVTYTPSFSLPAGTSVTSDQVLRHVTDGNAEYEVTGVQDAGPDALGVVALVKRVGT